MTYFKNTTANGLTRCGLAKCNALKHLCFGWRAHTIFTVTIGNKTVKLYLLTFRFCKLVFYLSFK